MSRRRWPGRDGSGRGVDSLPGLDSRRGHGSGWSRDRRHRHGRDRGSFTVEFAAGLPALMLMLLVGLTAVSAVSTRLQCLDAAREAAIAAARGESGPAAAARNAPASADISVSIGTDTTTAEVSSPVPILGGHLPLLTVRATAVAAREPEAP